VHRQFRYIWHRRQIANFPEPSRLRIYTIYPKQPKGLIFSRVFKLSSIVSGMEVESGETASVTKSSSGRVIALAPGGAAGVAVVAAAARASALGVLDLGGVRQADAFAATARLERLGVARYGVRISVSQLAAGGWIGGNTLDGGTSWIFGGPSWLNVHDLAVMNAIAAVRAAGYRVLIEARCRDEIHFASAVHADGIVVAGEEAGGWAGTASSFVLLQMALANFGSEVWVRGGSASRPARQAWYSTEPCSSRENPRLATVGERGSVGATVRMG
jgi:hypothetical protein